MARLFCFRMQLRIGGVVARLGGVVERWKVIDVEVGEFEEAKVISGARNQWRPLGGLWVHRRARRTASATEGGKYGSERSRSKWSNRKQALGGGRAAPQKALSLRSRIIRPNTRRVSWCNEGHALRSKGVARFVESQKAIERTLLGRR